MAITLNVHGMTCGGCSASVEKALKALDDQAGVSVDLSTGRVDMTSDKVDASQARTAIEAAGFDVDPE